MNCDSTEPDSAQYMINPQTLSKECRMKNSQRLGRLALLLFSLLMQIGSPAWSLEVTTAGSHGAP